MLLCYAFKFFKTDNSKNIHSFRGKKKKTVKNKLQCIIYNITIVS